jgi:hypothetical protein
MTILFRQDPFDGRCLALLSQGPSLSGNSSAYDLSPRGEDSGDEEVPEENGWKRVLFEDNRSFPDNYTPDSFLSYLTVNMDLTIYRYFPSVIATIRAFSVHASLVPIFFVVFYFLRISRMNPYHLISVDLGFMIAGYLAREMMVRHLISLNLPSFSSLNAPRGRSFGSEINPSFTAFPIHANSPAHTRSISLTTPGESKNFHWSLMGDLRPAFLVFGTIYILSPLLRTLTRSWSEDTIIAIAVTMLIVHLAFHDYDFISRTKTTLEQWYQNRGDVERVKRVWQRVDNSQALNAIIFSAIVLASRLNSFESVFGFIFFSITAFAFLPFVLKCINLLFPSFYLYVVCPSTVGLTAVMLQVFVGALPMGIFISVLAVIIFVCPYILVKAMPLKKAFKGPWDIALVKRRAPPITPVGNSVIMLGSGYQDQGKRLS